MKLASVFGLVCTDCRLCPHDWDSGAVSLIFALVALTRAALYRAAVEVLRACNRPLE